MKQNMVRPLAAVLGLMLLCQGCRKSAVLYENGTGEPAVSESGILETADPEESFEKESALFYVYVCGQVVNPGVYGLLEDSRIADAIEAAGGMTEEAAGTYLNLAERITDGQKIEVPTRSEAEALEAEKLSAQSGLVNLNTATADQLMTLTGIGAAKAEDIMSYREQHGGFQRIEELKEIPGIKDGVFQKIKDQITT